MLLFKNKLIGKKARDAGDGDQGINYGDSAQLQKAALSSLSKQEKLLLLELQRTRQSIVTELNRLDPTISADNWVDVQQTIATYQTKISRQAQEETVDGKNGRVVMLSGSKSLPGGDFSTIKGGSISSSMSMMTNPSKYQSITAERRNAAVRAAAQIPVHRIRTGLDMLPILSTNGESSLEVGLRKQAQLRLPVFKLPSIDANRMAGLMEDEGMARAVAAAMVAGSASSSGSPTKKFTTDVPIILRSERSIYRNHVSSGLDYIAALLSEIRNMPPLDALISMTHIGIGDKDLASVSAELERRLMLKITTDTETNGAITVFMKCQSPWQSSHQAAPHASSTQSRALSTITSIGAGGIDGLGSCSVVTGASLEGSRRGGSRAQSLTHSSSSHISKKSRSNVAPPPTPSDSLKTELIESLRSMQRSTEKVKHGIALIQSLGVSVNPRARARLFSVAAERLHAALSRIAGRDLQRGFLAWNLVLIQLRRQECTSKVLGFLGLRRLGRVLGTVAHRCLEKRLIRWVNFARKENARLERNQRFCAAIAMQRYLRGCMARDRVAQLRDNRKYKDLYAAVIKIQAQVKGRLVKWRYWRFTKARREDRASRKIQRVQRGHRGRKRVRYLRNQRHRGRAARRIQALARGRRDRLRIRGLHKERLHLLSTIKIQAIIRGFVSRRRTRQILHRILLDRAIRRVQAFWRGAIARMNIHRKKRELREYKEMRFKAALDVQRVFRGFRSRLTSRMRQIESERKKRKLDGAATKIITMCRGFIARYTVRKKRKERRKQILDDARDWVEQWSEDAEAFFYFNATTNETLWEPPRTGYTKVDGSLILCTGEVVDDPDLVEAEEEERKRALGHTCSECNDRVAIKLCKECGDNFCTPCFRTCHTAGARRLHSTEPLGPLDCSECEMVLAERWCVSCDEAFCDECWRRMHARGKRRFHPFSDVSERGKIDSRVYTMDGSEVSAYDASYTQNQWESAVEGERLQDANSYIDQQSAAAELQANQWAEYPDDRGVNYYYNSQTGESTYECPY